MQRKTYQTFISKCMSNLKNIVAIIIKIRYSSLWRPSICNSAVTLLYTQSVLLCSLEDLFYEVEQWVFFYIILQVRGTQEGDLLLLDLDIIWVFLFWKKKLLFLLGKTRMTQRQNWNLKFCGPYIFETKYAEYISK